MAAAAFLAACGTPGEVTFTIVTPALEPLNPLSRAATSDITLKRGDGTPLGVVSLTAMAPDRLALGRLPTIDPATDLELTLTAGADLLGKARLRDVLIRPGEQRTYEAQVRKPLVTVGSALPTEMLPMHQPRAGLIVDPATGQDLTTAVGGPKLPAPTSAATATWDGRFLIAGGMKGLSVVDTGSGATVGVAPLSFAPVRLATAPRDAAVAAIDAAGAVALYVDVGALTTMPESAMPRMVALPDVKPRTATFSADGQKLYVLGGGTADPCSAQPAPATNTITVVGLDGAIQGTWTLPGFAADLTVDPVKGGLILSDVTKEEVAILDPAAPFGAAMPTRLEGAKCPSALRVSNGNVYVVTSEADPRFKNARMLKRVPLESGTADVLAFEAPSYGNIQTSNMPSTGPTEVKVEVRPVAVIAYDMALTPDGTQAWFATRTRYREDRGKLDLIGYPCEATFDIVEYGYYVLDTRTGQASYQSRSTTLLTDPRCIICDLGLGVRGYLECTSTPGDRPAGITAVFGAP